MEDLKTFEGLPVVDQKIKNLIERFLFSQDVSESTRINYQKYLKRFFEWVKVEGLNLSDLTREDVIRYKKDLRETLTPDSVNSYLVAVRNFFKHVSSKTSFPNIAKDVKNCKIKKGFKKDALTKDQVKRLINSIDTETLRGLRDKALINLIAHTGLRRIEINRANVGDLRQEGEDKLLYVQGKGRREKDEFVVITDREIYEPLEAYLKAREKVESFGPLFVSHSNRNAEKRLTTRSISRIVKNRLREIGINNPRLSCHSLRHTALTLSLKAGASLEATQRLGRHKSINTTLIYLHHIDRLKDAPEKRITQYLNLNEKPNVSLLLKTDIEDNYQKGGAYAQI